MAAWAQFLVFPTVAESNSGIFNCNADAVGPDPQSDTCCISIWMALIATFGGKGSMKGVG